MIFRIRTELEFTGAIMGHDNNSDGVEDGTYIVNLNNTDDLNNNPLTNKYSTGCRAIPTQIVVTASSDLWLKLVSTCLLQKTKH